MEKKFVRGFNLSKTLESGQFFNYYSLDQQGYLVVDGGCFFEVRQENEKILFKGNCSEEHIIHLFSLDKPYDLILKSISKDNNVGKAISDNYGLRIMRQDLWQCVISFICSSVSNVPRIRSNIIHLSELFGKKLSNDGYAFHLFPSFDTLCKVDEKDIAKAGMGFRAKYVKEAALWFSEGRHLGLKNLNHSMAREHLMEIKGIGRKIAECICLFSLGFDDAFPVDVWIKREMERMYFKGKSTKIDEIESFGKEYFGRYCGWAQEFLFHNARTRKN